MAYTVLTVSGLFFWFVLAVVVLFIGGILSHSDDEAATVVLFGVLLAAIALFTDAFAGLTWVRAALFAVLYLGIGAGWSIWKWYRYLQRRRAEIVKSHWGSTMEKDGTTIQERLAMQRPTASENKARLTNWVVLWPFSFAWWVLSWPREFAVWIYNRLAGLYDRMAERIFS